MSDRIPTYRRKKTKTGTYGVVTLADAVGNRRDVILGRYGTAASRREYARVIAEWESAGRHLPNVSPTSRTINEIILIYWKHTKQHYRHADGTPTSEVHLIRLALRSLKALYGTTAAADFGPLAFKAVRETFVAAGLSRKTSNGQAGRIRRMFKWATENELVRPSVFHGLLAVRGLQYGRTAAKECEPVKPVPEAFVEATLTKVSRPVAAMIQLQMLTAARPGEICALRVCDLDMTGRVWVYTPQTHKTLHHGHTRQIYLGPQAQEIIKPFLATDLQAYLFSPAQARAERFTLMRERRKTKVQPSQVDRKKPRPKRPPRDHYDAGSYRHAINYGCIAAEVPAWNPHRLRHNAATRLRKEFGVELARIILGHATAFTTEIYAEADRVQAMEVIGKVG